MEAVRLVRSGLRATLSTLVVLALVGCTPSTSTSSSTTPPPASLTSAAGTSTSSAPSVGTTTGRSPTASASRSIPSALATAARLCLTSQLTASLGPGAGAAAGHTYPFLVLTNKGTTECSVTGYPGVSFVGDGNGTQLGAAATREAPGVPVIPLTLAPGASAHSQLSIATAANYDATTCRPKTADGLRVYPPDQTTSLFVATAAYTACQGTPSLLVVRPLQAGAA
jgi:hypothetical protein